MTSGNSTESSQSVQDAQENSDPTTRKVNIFCLCGAVVGIAAIFCDWFRVTQGDFGESIRLAELQVEILIPRYSLWYWYHAGVLFVVGSVLALYTPLAGFVQACGLGLTAVHIMDVQSDLHEGGLVVGWDVGPGLGVYMGVLSACIVIGSLAYPLGPGFDVGVSHFRDRLLVWGKKNHAKYYRRRSLDRVPHTPMLERLARVRKRVARGFSREARKWTAPLVGVMLWSATVVLLTGDVFEDDPLLTQVAGGIVIHSDSFGDGRAFQWDGMLLSLSDGEHGASWGFADVGLDNGTWTVKYLGGKAMGDLQVSLTALEKSGDGIFGFGDSLVLMAHNGTFFAEDLVYSMWWKTDRMIAWSGCELSFKFHDGGLDSWVSHEWFAGL